MTTQAKPAPGPLLLKQPNAGAPLPTRPGAMRTSEPPRPARPAVPGAFSAIQVINYHEIAAAPSNLHVLRPSEFDHQLDLIQDSGVNIVPADELTRRAPLRQGTAIAITFDDGAYSDLQSAEKLARRGLSATFFISSAHIGHSGYLTASDIVSLRRMGMAIGSHAHEHVRLTTLAPHEQARQIMLSKDIIESILGEGIDRLAFPGGAYSPAIAQLSRQAGFRHLFGTEWGLNHGTRHGADTVYRRNNITSGLTERQFIDLVTARHADWRALIFRCKTLLQQHLPDHLYRQLRDAFLKARPLPKG